MTDPIDPSVRSAESRSSRCSRSKSSRRAAGAIGRRGLVALLLAVSLAATTACRTPGAGASDNPHDPKAQLARLLTAWQSAHRDGDRCEQRRPDETPLVDCERIRMQMERLAIAFPNDPDVLLANAVVAFEALEELMQWHRQGLLKYRETIAEGIENAPRALINMLSGGNYGKQVVRLTAAAR